MAPWAWYVHAISASSVVTVNWFTSLLPDRDGPPWYIFQEYPEGLAERSVVGSLVWFPGLQMINTIAISTADRNASFKNLFLFLALLNVSIRSDSMWSASSSRAYSQCFHWIVATLGCFGIKKLHVHIIGISDKYLKIDSGIQYGLTLSSLALIVPQQSIII